MSSTIDAWKSTSDFDPPPFSRSPSPQAALQFDDGVSEGGESEDAPLPEPPRLQRGLMSIVAEDGEPSGVESSFSSLAPAEEPHSQAPAGAGEAEYDTGEQATAEGDAGEHAQPGDAEDGAGGEGDGGDAGDAGVASPGDSADNAGGAERGEGEAEGGGEGGEESTEALAAQDAEDGPSSHAEPSGEAGAAEPEPKSTSESQAQPSPEVQPVAASAGGASPARERRGSVRRKVSVAEPVPHSPTRRGSMRRVELAEADEPEPEGPPPDTPVARLAAAFLAAVLGASGLDAAPAAGLHEALRRSLGHRAGRVPAAAAPAEALEAAREAAEAASGPAPAEPPARRLRAALERKAREAAASSSLLKQLGDLADLAWRTLRALDPAEAGPAGLLRAAEETPAAAACSCRPPLLSSRSVKGVGVPQLVEAAAMPHPGEPLPARCEHCSLSVFAALVAAHAKEAAAGRSQSMRALHTARSLRSVAPPSLASICIEGEGPLASAASAPPGVSPRRGYENGPMQPLLPHLHVPRGANRGVPPSPEPPTSPPPPRSLRKLRSIPAPLSLPGSNPPPPAATDPSSPADGEPGPEPVPPAESVAPEVPPSPPAGWQDFFPPHPPAGRPQRHREVGPRLGSANLPPAPSSPRGLQGSPVRPHPPRPPKRPAPWPVIPALPLPLPPFPSAQQHQRHRKGGGGRSADRWPWEEEMLFAPPESGPRPLPAPVPPPAAMHRESSRVIAFPVAGGKKWREKNVWRPLNAKLPRAFSSARRERSADDAYYERQGELRLNTRAAVLAARGGRPLGLPAAVSTLPIKTMFPSDP